jgi:hypothetical protein
MPSRHEAGEMRANCVILFSADGGLERPPAGTITCPTGAVDRMPRMAKTQAS